jgi:Ni,Fe-hydrogenase I cytochrome b subunit
VSGNLNARVLTHTHIVLTDRRKQRQPNHNTTTYCVYRCLPLVNTICGCIMNGLSLLSSVSKHNMWSYYDWVVVVVVRQLCLLPDNNNDNPIIIRPHSVKWRTTTTTTQSQYDHILVNTICGCIMNGLSLLSSVSKHNMWSYYDWVVVVVVRQ